MMRPRQILEILQHLLLSRRRTPWPSRLVKRTGEKWTWGRCRLRRSCAPLRPQLARKPRRKPSSAFLREASAPRQHRRPLSEALLWNRPSRPRCRLLPLSLLNEASCTPRPSPPPRLSSGPRRSFRFTNRNARMSRLLAHDGDITRPRGCGHHQRLASNLHVLGARRNVKPSR